MLIIVISQSFTWFAYNSMKRKIVSLFAAISRCTYQYSTKPYISYIFEYILF